MAFSFWLRLEFQIVTKFHRTDKSPVVVVSVTVRQVVRQVVVVVAAACLCIPGADLLRQLHAETVVADHTSYLAQT